MSFSIVICSKNITNLTACVRAIREADEKGRIIIVWDGAPDAVSSAMLAAHPLILPMELRAGCMPFVFARNCNIGIRAAGTDDVVLLNDDCLLETPGGLTSMSQAIVGHTLMSPRVRGPAHPVHSIDQQNPNGCPAGPSIPFVCVYLPRVLINAVGLLDERFVPGGYEDDDYCRRVRNMGGTLAIYNGCVVDHRTLPHTFRPEGQPDTYDLPANRMRYEEKWRGK